MFFALVGQTKGSRVKGSSGGFSGDGDPSSSVFIVASCCRRALLGKFWVKVAPFELKFAFFKLKFVWCEIEENRAKLQSIIG